MMILAVVLCLLQDTQAFPAATPESQGLSAEALQQLDEIAASCVEIGWVVGAELLVIKNRHTVLHTVHGWRDRDEERPMEKETIFNLRSMAKPLVGATTQFAIQAGEVALSDGVAQHLPSFEEGAAASITVEQLLTHRSGLPDTNPAGPMEDYPDLHSVADYWGTHGRLSSGQERRCSTATPASTSWVPFLRKRPVARLRSWSRSASSTHWGCRAPSR